MYDQTLKTYHERLHFKSPIKDFKQINPSYIDQNNDIKQYYSREDTHVQTFPG